MGTEILQPHDLLARRFHVPTAAFHRRRNFPAQGDLTNLAVNRRPSSNNNNNSGYRKKSPKPDKRKSNETKRVTHSGDIRRKETVNGGGGGGGPGMGQVTILRRGQSYDSLAAKLNGRDARSEAPPAKSSADDMAMFPKQIRLSPPPLADVYAGSAFFISPSPRSLPLPSPSFFNKKQQDSVKPNPSDDPATRDLRRLLRLE